jgi:hypothetical protein
MANPVARRRRTACGDRRAFAYGLFTGTYRTAWALGSMDQVFPRRDGDA